MLVRSSVEDSVRTVLLEDVLDAAAIADVSDYRNDLDIGEREAQLLEDVEDRVLSVSEENQSRWGESRELSA
jgi:hypothetical protein